MKKITTVLLVLCLLALSTATLADGEKPECQKFKTTFIVTYNAITLEEAARKEAAFRETYKGACKVDVELEKVVNLYTTGDIIEFYTTDNNITTEQLERLF